MLGSSRVAAQLAASEKGLSSMSEFVILIIICEHEVVCGQEVGEFAATIKTACSAYE
jgi:hypothetical protein